MKRLMTAAALAGAMFFANGCASMGPYVPGGALYTSIKGPVGFANVRKGKGSKMGQSCGSNILGIVGTGNNSIEAAKAAGGIKKVMTVDYETFSILGLYTKVCTNVTGD